jgi:hypothetical protein
VCNDGSGSRLCQLRHLGLPRFRALHAGGKTPTSCLVSYYLHSGYNAPRAVRSREGRRRSDLSRLRVQTPLYRRGSGYRLGGRMSDCWLLCPCLTLLCPRLTMALYKAPFPPWIGIWEVYALPFASDPFVGKDLALRLVESGRGLRHARPSPLSILSGPCHFRRNSRWRNLVFIARLRLSSVESPASCWRCWPFGPSRSS